MSFEKASLPLEIQNHDEKTNTSPKIEKIEKKIKNG